MDMNDAIRIRIHQLLSEEGWTINELIRRSNLHQPTVSEFMRGKTKSPTIITITKIAKGFNMTLSDFFNNEIFTGLEKDINDKTIEEIFADIKVSETNFGYLELSDFPTELLNRAKTLFSKIGSLEPFGDLIDKEGVFLGKQGYERLEKVVHHLNEIEKIISVQDSSE
ncbi:hypothetical protein LSPCS325_52030 [Lysinibacillus sp. CTST325]